MVWLKLYLLFIISSVLLNHVGKSYSCVSSVCVCLCVCEIEGGAGRQRCYTVYDNQRKCARITCTFWGTKRPIDHKALQTHLFSQNDSTSIKKSILKSCSFKISVFLSMNLACFVPCKSSSLSTYLIVFLLTSATPKKIEVFL